MSRQLEFLLKLWFDGNIIILVIELKSDKKIFIAFVLNLLFSVIEFIGGTITGSVAIISDSVHDFGDSISIGIAYFLEKISKKSPDSKYTYGYLRYSLLGSVLTTCILLFGSLAVIYNSIIRLLNPVSINYNGMIILAVIGTCINLLAAFFSSGEGSLNQKSINLHMLEDVLGWIIVLIGAVLMKFTNAVFIDAILSVAVSVFIFVNALKNLKCVLDIFLIKTPESIDVEELKEHILSFKEVIDVHHLHVWSIDGINNLATMHIVTDANTTEIKSLIKNELKNHSIAHATIEIESSDEICKDINCEPHKMETHKHHHNHHHGHHH